VEDFVLIPEVLLLLHFFTFFSLYFLIATQVSATSLPLSLPFLFVTYPPLSCCMGIGEKVGDGVRRLSGQLGLSIF